MRFDKLSEKTRICKMCFNEIEDTLHSVLHRDMPICHRCFQRFNPELRKFKIGRIDGLFIFYYDDTVKELLYQFKGCFDIELSHAFLPYFTEYLRLKYFGFSLIPAPSSKEGDVKRGFNHVIEMFSVLKLPMIRCIHKTKDVKQADLDSKQREEVGKILEIDNVDLTNKKVLIVDDVYTTGSTIKSMIKLVESKNPKRIEVLVMSKTMGFENQNRPN